jgi:hypothetical protein
LARTSDTGVFHIKYGQGAHIFTPVAGGVHNVLNAGDMYSSEGLGHAGNPRVTEAKTIDPLRHVWVTPIMTLVVPTATSGEETGGGDRTTKSAYSQT